MPRETITIESRTEPLELEADAGQPCTIRAQLNGVEVLLISWMGCFVIRREISLPKYHNPGVFQP